MVNIRVTRERKHVEEMDKIEDDLRDKRPTKPLSPEEILSNGPSIAIVLAGLERFSPWARYAFKLGTLALLQECIQEMTSPNAKAELVVKARELVEALAHMPWET